MRKVIIASDSFKGTLSSIEISDIFATYIKSLNQDIEVIKIPIADGGEGSNEAISKSIEGSFKTIKVKGPYFIDMEVQYYFDKNKTAYIETASSSGLSLVLDNKNPSLTTTYGLGQQIKAAIENGAKHIVVSLGGSCTNDGGCGLFAALGTKFYDKENIEFIPTGKTLINIERIDNSETEELLKDINITAMCDVNNPFFGPTGAAYIYSPQKGADEEMVKMLDDGLKHLSSIIFKCLHKDISILPGSGAAGGLGGGLVAFGNAHLKSGIETILDLVDFDEKLKDVELVYSGEGRLDRQSFSGKVIDGVAKRCQKKNVPLKLIVGASLINKEEAKQMLPIIDDIYVTNYQNLPFDEIKNKAREMYIDCLKRNIH